MSSVLPTRQLDSLLLFAKNIHSQAGQDGMIAELLRRIQIGHGFFVEFGAADGIYLSNCRSLYERGWKGAFIEANPASYAELVKNYENDRQMILANEKVTTQGDHSLESILRRAGHRGSVDVVSIDIDGQDLEIFESFEAIKPAIICLEGGQGAHPFDSRKSGSEIVNIGQSLSVIQKSAFERGYLIAAAYQDVILVREELYSKFAPPQDIVSLYVEGLKYQPYHLPEFKDRLSALNRRNPIIDFTLSNSRYSHYKNRDLWLKERVDSVLDLLSNLPEEIANRPASN